MQGNIRSHPLPLSQDKNSHKVIFIFKRGSFCTFKTIASTHTHTLKCFLQGVPCFGYYPFENPRKFFKNKNVDKLRHTHTHTHSNMSISPKSNKKNCGVNFVFFIFLPLMQQTFLHGALHPRALHQGC